MSSVLKDCQQVCEAGTLEGDRKRAFGLFFSPRNPAPLANPPTAEISLLHKSARREEQNQSWKGPAKGWPQARAQRAVAQGRKQVEKVTTLPALFYKAPGGALALLAPQYREEFTLQSLWFASEHVWHFQVASGCRHLSWASSAGMASENWNLPDLVSCKSRNMYNSCTTAQALVIPLAVLDLSWTSVS